MIAIFVWGPSECHFLIFSWVLFSGSTVDQTCLLLHLEAYQEFLHLLRPSLLPLTSGQECTTQAACEGLQLAWPGPRGLIKGINGEHYLSDS